MNQIPTLFAQKKDCCGCEACKTACPKGAISMSEDECGYRYPVIDEAYCIGCGRCKAVCAYQKRVEARTPKAAYAARSSDRAQAKKSASGGIFAALASEVLASGGGIVFGAAYSDDRRVHHIAIDSADALEALQGSKYTQSETGDCYKQAQEALKAGKKVLYSGTPCQIAGLYGYLGRDYENLVTVDLVCHGVPSGKMFRDYLSSIEAKEGGGIKDFSFRDKSLGWGKNGSVTLEKEGKTLKKKLWESESPYFYYFGQGVLARENCYSCPYASANRPADLTIGDFWGIERAHPDYLKDGWKEKEGISLILANSEKGVSALEAYGRLIEKKPSTFEKIAAGNHNLRAPSDPGKHESILADYRAGAWKALETRYQKKIGWHRYASRLKSLLPSGIKRTLKRMSQK